jgi:hypothetical protein
MRTPSRHEEPTRVILYYSSGAGFSSERKLRDAAKLTRQIERGTPALRRPATNARYPAIGISSIPVWEDASKAARARTSGNWNGPAIPNIAREERCREIRASSQFRQIMHEAKIGGRVLRAATGKGRKQSSLSFHSLRHSFVSALANAGVAADLRQKLDWPYGFEVTRPLFSSRDRCDALRNCYGSLSATKLRNLRLPYQF